MRRLKYAAIVVHDVELTPTKNGMYLFQFFLFFQN
jgi:hypothetical protein